MMRITLLLTSFVILCSIGQAEAQTLTACPPRTVDGTQIIVEENGGTSCEGKQHHRTYTVDTVLKVLCITQAGLCIPESKMTPAQKELYLSLIDSQPRIRFETKECIQRGSTWVIVMVTGVKVPCTPHQHAIRYINTAAEIGCVRSGASTIGCVSLTREVVTSTLALLTH